MIYPVTIVVFSCSEADVETVLIDGEVVVEDRKLANCDEKRIEDAARQTIKRIRNKTIIQGGIKRKYC